MSKAKIPVVNVSTINPLKFAVDQKWLSLAVFGSLVTWALLNSIKQKSIDVLMDIAIPPSKFDKLDIRIDDTHTIEMGIILRDIAVWMIIMGIILVLYKLLEFV